MNIKQKSGILSWTEDNIKNASNESGVFILRTSPTTDSIKFIEASQYLKDALLIKIKDASISEIKFFDWYTTHTFDEAKKLANDWTEKYIS